MPKHSLFLVPNQYGTFIKIRNVAKFDLNKPKRVQKRGGVTLKACLLHTWGLLMMQVDKILSQSSWIKLHQVLSKLETLAIIINALTNCCKIALKSCQFTCGIFNYNNLSTTKIICVYKQAFNGQGFTLQIKFTQFH